MKLSEQTPRRRPKPPPSVRHSTSSAPRSAAEPVAVDAVTEMKTRAHEALFARLGLRLFDSTLSQDQLHAYVAQEISDLMAAAPALLSPAERQQLVEEIMDDVVGLGPHRAVPRRPHDLRGDGQRHRLASTWNATG